MESFRSTFPNGSKITERFEIIKSIGIGSLDDDVYLAKQLDLDRNVTLRILPKGSSTDKEMVARFKQEIKMTAALRHPNILATFESGEYLGRLFFVTAHEEGEYLDKFLEKEKMDAKDSVKYTKGLASALQFAWDHNKILHRNVKPSNIMITESDEAILEDFGMAKATEENSQLTMVGVTIGNPQYMSPEQVKGETDLDCRSDIYCLGLVLYELLTAKKTFQEKGQVALMEAHLRNTPEAVTITSPETPLALVNVLNKMLAKDKNDRQQSWEEVIKDLDHSLNAPKEKLTINKTNVPDSGSKIEESENSNGNGKLFIILGVLAFLIVIIIGLIIALFVKQ